MYDIALTIKRSDWLYILIIGVVFAMLLSSLGYRLMGLPWLEGASFGIILGFTITLFSLFFITLMNQKLLPKVDRGYWLPLAILFSFLSGFLGTVVTTKSATWLDITLIEMFRTESYSIAVAIGVLTYIVGALLYRFVKMRNEKELVDHHYVQSRLRSLETQLNPHFLFNALNSVAELIHQDPTKAEEAVLRISSFLRNSMKEAALIPLHEELKNAQDYVELENIRFSGSIVLELPDEKRLGVMVPKFSIQLLIENAIKHGMSAAVTSLRVAVAYDAKANAILLSNDGLPMRSKRLGIGLGNLDERLQHLCGGHLEITQLDPPLFTLHLGACHENTDSR